MSIPQKLDSWDFSEKKESTFNSMHCSCALDVFWGLHFALSRYTLILVKMVLHVDPKSTLTPCFNWCFMSRYFLYKCSVICMYKHTIRGIIISGSIGIGVRNRRKTFSFKDWGLELPYAHLDFQTLRRPWV